MDAFIYNVCALLCLCVFVYSHVCKSPAPIPLKPRAECSTGERGEEGRHAQKQCDGVCILIKSPSSLKYPSPITLTDDQKQSVFVLIPFFYSPWMSASSFGTPVSSNVGLSSSTHPVGRLVLSALPIRLYVFPFLSILCQRAIVASSVHLWSSVLPN